MAQFLDITGEHIAELNDADLRTLVARLCEAELRHMGLPAAAVTAGGDQDAPDGGIDVRVALPATAKLNGFIPRPATGFQVKVPKMRPADIAKEMSSGGQLRPVIRELADMQGAYVIVSSKDSTSDSALRQRREAMQKAASELEQPPTLHLDYYDQERIASWVRNHPGIAAWVRARIGAPLRGWRPYESWATPGETIEAEYLLDESSRLFDTRNPGDGEISIVEGIRRVRKVLNSPKGSVRLIGLSGTGKTRLVQALFDERVSQDAMDPHLAVYTDLADQPDPSPRDLVTSLVHSRHRAIIVVDNCPPETHRALTASINSPESLASLITVEYDVGDDQPEDTEVFLLEPASGEVIERLIEARAPHISQVDRRSIAEFSGGNARIALALAITVGRGESIARLNDRQLFERLFRQRQVHDNTLQRVAEACALVYSFDGETLEGDAAEIPLLAELAGLPVAHLYRHVGELQGRDLVQKRSRWRAVLPHAIALRLARLALEHIPPSIVSAIFIDRAPERLLVSFTRRLGLLHDSDVAKRIVQTWISGGGPLSDLSELTPPRIKMFRNVAPVAPAAVIAIMENTANKVGDFLSIGNRERSTWITLLKSLAYDASFFDRAARLLSRFVLAEPEGHRHNSARDHFRNLFQLYLSGTHATIDQRSQLMMELLRGETLAERRLGLDAMEALLQTQHFSSTCSFEFGAHSRDYGWLPASRNEVVGWYRPAIESALQLALSESPLNERACSILADKFTGLWLRAGMYDELENVALKIREKGPWPEAWIAVRKTLRLNKGSREPSATSLRKLEQKLGPASLLESIHAYVLAKPGAAIDLADIEDGEKCGVSTAHERIGLKAQELGAETASNRAVADTVLPLVVRKYGLTIWPFGSGLALGADCLEGMWQTIVRAFAAAPEEDRTSVVLKGFLHEANKIDPTLTSRFLDEALAHPDLGPYFPSLQTAIPIDGEGVVRLEESLRIGMARSWSYNDLRGGRVTEPIPSDALRRIVMGICDLSKGFEAAVEVFGMHLYLVRDSANPIDTQLIQCGQELLLRLPVGLMKDRRECDYQLGLIAENCFRGPEAKEAAEKLCRILKLSISEHYAFASDYRDLIVALFSVQPNIALDAFLGEQEGFDANEVIDDLDSREKSPLDVVADDALIAWANLDPPVRFPLLARGITLFSPEDKGAPLSWSPRAALLLRVAPNRIAVLDTYFNRFRPSGWSGSLADILEKRLSLVYELLGDHDENVRKWAADKVRVLTGWVQQERAQERRSDEKFE